MRFEFIEAHRGEFSIAAMCRALSVGRSGYYQWREREQSRRAAEDEQLATEVREVFEQKKGRYGALRVTRELRRRGRRTSKRRVARLMRQQGLRARRPRRRVMTTDSRHDEPIARNVIKRGFSAEAPNQKWAGDITYIRTDEGWLYLAVFLDLFNRQVIGWSMSDRLEATLATSALSMALLNREPKGALVVHSDRGIQYAAGDFRRMLSDWSITPSMSRKGNCYDNAVSESFFATLKKELVHEEHYRTRAEAEASIFEYIEVFYDRQRLHSTLDYVPPIEFERNWIAAQAASEESATVGNSSPIEELSMGVDDRVGTGITVANSSLTHCPV